MPAAGKEALQSFENAAALQPLQPGPYLHLAKLRLVQQDPQSALLLLAKLREEIPQTS